MRWAGHVTHVGDRRGANSILVGRPDRKRPLGRPYVYERIILK